MIFETRTEKILKLFLIDPLKEYYYNEIQKLTNLGSSTVKKNIIFLLKKKLIKKISMNNKIYFKADRESQLFKQIKIFNTLISLNEVKTIISKKTLPNCIILFGSASKGENTIISDIDLFVQSARKEFDLGIYTQRQVKFRI